MVENDIQRVRKLLADSGVIRLERILGSMRNHMVGDRASGEKVAEAYNVLAKMDAEGHPLTPGIERIQDAMTAGGRAPISVRAECIEAAAKAIAEKWQNSEWGTLAEGVSSYREDGLYKEDCRNIAMCALEAIIKRLERPSNAMLRAGTLAPNHLEDQTSHRGCGNIWQAMLATLEA